METHTRDPLDELTIDLAAIARFLVSHLKILLVGALLGALAGGAFAMLQTKSYEASARVLYGTVRGGGTDQRTTLDTGIGDMPLDAQIELIRSDATVERVIEMLHLDTDARAKAEFSRPSLLTSLLGSHKPEERAGLVEAILRRLDVKRVGRSPIIEISFKASDPTLAAETANAFATAYVGGQVAANAALSSKTSQWLAARIDDLRAKSIAKDEEISTFKASHDLQVDADGGSLVEKRLADLDSDLLKAQAALTALKGKQAQLEGLARSGAIADVTDAVDDPGITGLREKYFSALERRTALAIRVNPDNRLIDTVDREIESIKTALIERSKRAAEATSREVEITQARIAALQAERAGVADRARETDTAIAQLQRLKAEADVLRKSYLDSLGRYETALRDESYPVADARVISQAEVPRQPVNAGLIRSVAIFAVLGVVLALGFCVVRYFLRSGPKATRPAPFAVPPSSSAG